MARPKKGEETGWRKNFLLALAQDPYVAVAAREVGVSTSTVYAHKKKDPEFAEAMQAAMEDGLDLVEYELANIGKGKQKGQYGALIYLLKARRYEVRNGANIPSQLTVTWGTTEEGAI